MAVTEDQLRATIVEIGRLMYQKGWVAANDGNISVRLGPGEYLCTPTNISKGMMTPGDLIVVDDAGRKLRGTRERTSEILLHLTVYRMREDVQAVVHAHPPTATGFAVAGRALNKAILPEVVVNFGSIPLAAYGLPGTPDLTEPMLPLIPNYNAILMSNHGAVTCGSDLWQAFFRMETVEHVARISLVAELLGGPNLLSRQQVQDLFTARERYGVQCPNQPVPAHPLVSEDLETAPQRPAELTALVGQLLD
jgi:L-fuculose-phosphate aldolase